MGDLPSREEGELLLETARIWTSESGILEMPSAAETRQLIALARLGLRYLHPSEEDVERLGLILLALDEGAAEYPLSLAHWSKHWADMKAGAHAGDCTKQPHTCLRCLYEGFVQDARVVFASLQPKDPSHD